MNLTVAVFGVAHSLPRANYPFRFHAKPPRKIISHRDSIIRAEIWLALDAISNQRGERVLPQQYQAVIQAAFDANVKSPDACPLPAQHASAFRFPQVIHYN